MKRVLPIGMLFLLGCTQTGALPEAPAEPAKTRVPIDVPSAFLCRWPILGALDRDDPTLRRFETIAPEVEKTRADSGTGVADGT